MLLNFFPETILSLTGAALLIFMLLPAARPQSFTKSFMTLAGAMLLAACLLTLRREALLFHGTYQINLFSQSFKFLLGLSYLVVLLFAEKWTGISESRRTEFYLLLTTALLGMMMMVSAVHTLAFYVALELSSYSLYLLAALRDGKKQAEAAVKYVVMGAAASGVFLWGLSLMIGVAGTASLEVIAQNAASLASEPAFGIGLLLVLVSFFFKLSGFPLHAWAPDVYESASTSVVSFIATASKAAGAAIVIRFLATSGVSGSLAAAIGAAAFASMTFGNCVALLQQDVKRLLAYSSIAQAGYLLVGLLAGSTEGYSSAMFYAFGYAIMNAGAFLAVVIVAEASGKDNPAFEDFNGLSARSPFVSLILLLSLLSLAGIPPLVGFTGKWILFSAAMEKGHWFLVLWGVLNSVVSLFYYLTLVKHAYLEKPRDTTPLTLSPRFQVLGIFLFAALVALGIFPNNLILLTREAISAAFFIG